MLLYDLVSRAFPENEITFIVIYNPLKLGGRFRGKRILQE